MAAVSETRTWDALVSTTLTNASSKLEDQIATSNAFFYKLKSQGLWNKVASLGDRVRIPLMYELGSAGFYSGYDTLDTTPMDGITSAFWDWRQMAVPITISRLEERQNSGEHQLVDLLKAKTKQAMLGIEDLFGRAFFQGQGAIDAASLATAYTDAGTGASGFDPIGLLIKYDPTSSTTIGSINQSTETWWRNQYLNSAADSYAKFLKDLRKLNNDCSKGSGGSPDLHVCDQGTFELYEAALAALHQNQSYVKADIPFQNLMFKGQPVVWDQFVADVDNGSTTITDGTWYMINTKYFSVKVDKSTDFITTPFVKPENQDAKVAHILWYGAICVSNRRKHGVLGDIAPATAS